jgi:hypothetical protein
LFCKNSLAVLGKAQNCTKLQKARALDKRGALFLYKRDSTDGYFFGKNGFYGGYNSLMDNELNKCMII